MSLSECFRMIVRLFSSCQCCDSYTLLFIHICSAGSGWNFGLSLREISEYSRLGRQSCAVQNTSNCTDVQLLLPAQCAQGTCSLELQLSYAVGILERAHSAQCIAADSKLD